MLRLAVLSKKVPGRLRASDRASVLRGIAGSGRWRRGALAVDRSNPTAHAVGSRADFVERFATGKSIAEEIPIRAFRMDVRPSQALVVAVVPFDQVAIDFGPARKTREFAGSARAL